MVIDQELSSVEQAMRGAVASDVGLLQKASEHVLRSGGKRLRPRLVLLSYQAAGGEEPGQVVPLAAAVELLHTASLVHDDINDRSDTRRGATTVNANWGDGLALLTGDYMFVKLFSLIASFETRVIQILANACVDMVEGETQQMLTLGDLEMNEETYIRIVGRKTASLFAACAELGGMVARADEEQVRALKEFGLNLGISFQMRDDTLDLVGKKDELGKPVANDLAQGKMSLATLYALRTVPGARALLTSDDLPAMLTMLRASGALDYAMRVAGEYCQRAQAALAVLPPSSARQALTDTAAFCLTRAW